MRTEEGGLKQCEAHGLNFDPRLTRGCVLCRKNPYAADSARNARSFTLGGVLLFGALVTFVWVYVRPLLTSDGSARTSFTGLAPDAARKPPPALPPPEETLTAGAAAPVAVPALAAQEPTELRPLQPELWSEVARDFEPYADEAVVQELAGAYGIHVYVPRQPVLSVAAAKLVGARPSSADVAIAVGFVEAQLARYPRPFMQRIGFQQLVLVAGLKQKGVAAGAFVMAPAGAMFADPRSLDAEYAFHHELFHFADYRLHGRPPEHEAFSALNPQGARYRNGGRQMVGASPPGNGQLTAPRSDLPGFVTAYAQAASEEDMAEVFATLMARRPFATELLAKDPVVAAKAKYVREAVDRVAPGTSTALGL